MARTTYAVGEVKSGFIRPFHGLIVNIPAGWVLCDGSSGTPDLRDVFPKGAPAGQEAGATGGNATHTHADHPASATSQASADLDKKGTAAAVATTQTHTHTTPVLGHDTISHEPPYRTVLWIMKT